MQTKQGSTQVSDTCRFINCASKPTQVSHESAMKGLLVQSRRALDLVIVRVVEIGQDEDGLGIKSK